MTIESHQYILKQPKCLGSVLLEHKGKNNHLKVCVRVKVVTRD